MAMITDLEVLDGIRMIKHSLNQFRSTLIRVSRSPAIITTLGIWHRANGEMFKSITTEGQHHLELDETQLESTGKSASIDEVLTQIDNALAK